MNKKMSICDFTTKELVEELKQREGVKTIVAEPYDLKELKVEGPAILLVVMD